MAAIRTMKRSDKQKEPAALIEQTDRKGQRKKVNQIVTNVLAHISENQLTCVHSVHLPRRKLLPEFL